MDRGLDFALSLLPVLLGLCLLLAWAASLAAPVGRAWRGEYSWLPGAGLYALAFAGLAWGLSKTRPEHEGRVAGVLIGGSALLKLGLAWAAASLPLNTDQEIFHYFARQMADGRLAGETLNRLSQMYDYPVWAGRVMPIHYAVRQWLGSQDLFWIRVLNVGLSSALWAATYGFACRLLACGRRKWALFLMLALPFQWGVVTDYSHHLFSSFYFLVCMWCGWALMYSRPGVLRWFALSLGMGLCLLLMMWQRGMHLIALGTFGVLLVWGGLAGIGWRRWGGLCLGWVVIPLAVSLPPAQMLDTWLDRHDAGRLNSVLPAFVARGWCPETGGEYCGRYEQLDRVTPAGQKEAAMLRLVLSQIRYNPRTVCLRFPLVKTAKLFLVGYAANLEESLAAADSGILPWVRGLRLAAAPVFLGLAFWGCMVLASTPTVQRRWMPVLLALVLTWGAYVFAGETSPRYSIFCQPFLALLGALALGGADPAAGRSGGGVPWRGLVFRAGLVVGLLAAALGAATWAVRWIPADRLYADLEHGWESSADPGPAVLPGRMRPFEVRLPFSPRSWRLPPGPRESRVMSLYLLDGHGADPEARVRIRAGSTILWERQFEAIRFPHFVELPIPVQATELVFEGTGAGSGTWSLGYVAFRQEGDAP